MTDRPSDRRPGANAPEFSRPINADRVQGREMVETIAATQDERRALARRLELEDIGRLTATVRLKRVRGGTMIRVAGRLEADVVQTCVLSLDPVPATVVESFAALFAPESELAEEGGDIDVDMAALEDEEDLPEPMTDGRIDLGELIAQHLSLALDPYPRAEGAAFNGLHEDGEDAAPEEEAEAEAKPNPFAALAKLKRPN